MRRLLSGLFLLAALSGAIPARATIGGESLCEVLGYDPAAKCVYVHQLDWSGRGSFGRVSVMPVQGKDAGVLRSLGWPRGDYDDAGLAKRLSVLRARLKPLQTLILPSLPTRTHVLATDSIPNEFGEARRLRVRASFFPDVELTCWGTAMVSRSAAYELPDGAGQFWVIAFIGDPFELGYETQVPVFVPKGRQAPIEVKWSSGVE